jgi:hypothetical protein
MSQSRDIGSLMSLGSARGFAPAESALAPFLFELNQLASAGLVFRSYSPNCVVWPITYAKPSATGWLKLATPARFERATYGLEVRCSIQLSYGA